MKIEKIEIRDINPNGMRHKPKQGLKGCLSCKRIMRAGDSSLCGECWEKLYEIGSKL